MGARSPVMRTRSQKVVSRNRIRLSVGYCLIVTKPAGYVSLDRPLVPAFEFAVC